MATATIDTKINALATAIAQEFNARGGGIIDYASGIYSKNEYTAPEDGVIYAYFKGKGANVCGFVVYNKKQFDTLSFWTPADNGCTIPFPVKKADKFAIKMEGDSNNGSYAFLNFYPYVKTK